MPTIDVNDFWTQALAAILAALVMLFIRPQWLRRPDKAKTPFTPSVAGNSNDRGNQAILSGNTIGNDLHLDQSYTDNSQQTTIITNLNAAAKPPSSSSSDDEWGKIILMVLLAIAGACLFVTGWPLILAISCAAVAVVTVMTVVAALRSQRMLHHLPRKGRAALAISGLAVATTALTWWRAPSLQRNGMSLELIAAAIPKITSEQGGSGLPGYLDYFISIVAPAFFGTGEFALHFVLLLLLGVFASIMLTLLAWHQMHEWHSFLSFNLDTKRSERVTRAAKTFQEGRVVPPVLSALIISAIAFFCTSGTPFDLMHSALTASSVGPADSGR